MRLKIIILRKLQSRIPFSHIRRIQKPRWNHVWWVMCDGFFFIRDQFVETRCRGVSIPTTAAAEVALLHSSACLQDFQGSVGPFVGTSGSNLSHRHHTFFLYKLPSTPAHTCGHTRTHTQLVHVCMRLTHTQPQRGTVAITCDPHPPRLKCDSLLIALLLLFS